VLVPLLVAAVAVAPAAVDDVLGCRHSASSATTSPCSCCAHSTGCRVEARSIRTRGPMVGTAGPT
jgi:hypothetical protein